MIYNSQFTRQVNDKSENLPFIVTFPDIQLNFSKLKPLRLSPLPIQKTLFILKIIKIYINSSIYICCICASM